VLHFDHVMPEELGSKVAVNSDNIADLQHEVARLRDRTHKLESAVRGVGVLTEAVRELQESMPNLARRAAREAVAEDRRARHRDFFSNLRTYAAIASGGVALGALIVSLVHG
jgi:predicted  nucleic acid-binding Zn-ribbon protein